VSKTHLCMFLPALGVILLDQISKQLVLHTLDLHETVAVIPGFFDLVHVRNRGMAFGLLNRPGMDLIFYVLVAATIAVVLLMLYWFTRIDREDARAMFGLSLIIGGAVGNIIDRLRFKEVVDFLDFYLGAHHWPAFNVADSAITVGALWLAVHVIFFQPRRKPSGKEPQKRH
jgi:signal peptidase II